MLKNEIVRIRPKRYFAGEKHWVFIGRVISMNDTLVHIEGKGILLHSHQEMAFPAYAHSNSADHVQSQALPVEVDVELRPIIIPISNIADIRILPLDFDLNNLHLFTEGHKIGIRVPGAAAAWIGECDEV